MSHRPYMVRFGNCERVLVSGLTFTNSPMFHVALSGIEQLTAFAITIESPEAPNTDGVDPSGAHQLIRNCVISCGDDNIAVRAGNAFCSDLTVADCAFGLGHRLSAGGQSNRGLDGMTVKNCTFDGTVSGLRLKAAASALVPDKTSVSATSAAATLTITPPPAQPPRRRIPIMQ